MTEPTVQVFGEPLSALLGALRPAMDTAHTDESGMTRISYEAPMSELIPVMRALKRAEAKLLLEEADLVGSDAEEERSDEQRRADAFVELCLAIGAASRS